jgi:hypothetical protein
MRKMEKSLVLHLRRFFDRVLGIYKNSFFFMAFTHRSFQTPSIPTKNKKFMKIKIIFSSRERLCVRKFMICLSNFSFSCFFFSSISVFTSVEKRKDEKILQLFLSPRVVENFHCVFQELRFHLPSIQFIAITILKISRITSLPHSGYHCMPCHWVEMCATVN